MKKLFLSILGMLCSSVIVLAVPLESGDFKTQFAPEANAVDKPFFTVSSDKITCAMVNDPVNPWEVNEAGEVVSVNKEHNSSSEIAFQLNCSESFMISFSHCVSSEGADRLQIIFDGNRVANYGGENNILKEEIFAMSGGSHVLTFRYAKDGSVNRGKDCAWFQSLDFFVPADTATVVNVGAPGSLGLEILSKFQTLPDVNFLKITGTLNNDDFITLKNMPNLYYLDMGDALALEIPEATFKDKKLQNVIFPANLKKIGNQAFYVTDDRVMLVGELVLPEGLEELGESAFRGTSISSCALPVSLKKAGDYAFRNCDKLKTFASSPLLHMLPNEFLYSCDSLRTVTNMENVQNVGSYCFSDCRKLETVGNMKPVEVLDYAFQNCNKLQHIDLSQVVQLNRNSFYDCDSLKQVDISKAKTIAYYAFGYCDGLRKVVIPDVTEQVEGYAFNKCLGLEEVVLGASLTHLSSGLFYQCVNLKKIVCRAPSPSTWENSDLLPAEVFTKATLVVPDYAMSNYKLADNWSNFKTVVSHSDMVNDLTLAGTLDLTTNARVPGSPNVHQKLDSHLTINGENPQIFGAYTFELNDPAVNYYYNEPKENAATFICRSSAVTANQVNVRSFMTASKWYFISYPFDVQMSDISTENGAHFAIRYYDGAARAANGAGGSWIDVPEEGNLVANQGYIVQLNKSDWFNVKATPETRNDMFESGVKEVPLRTYAAVASADRSWNFIGNPFPAFYDIYHLDFTAPLTVWDGVNNTYKAYSVADDEYALKPMEAFFVQCPDEISAVRFNIVGRQAIPKIDHSLYPTSVKRSSVAARYLMDLYLSDGQYEDRTRIVFNADYSDSYESEVDAAKMMSHAKEAPQLYSWTEEATYAINEGTIESGKVNLGVYLPKDGTYMLSLRRGDLPVELIDLQTASVVDLSLPYSFESNAGQFDQRFVLRMKKEEVTGIEKGNVEAQVAVVAGGLEIKAGTGSFVQVYGADGRLMVSETLEGQRQYLSLPKGLYVVVVNGQAVKALVY